MSLRVVNIGETIRAAPRQSDGRSRTLRHVRTRRVALFASALMVLAACSGSKDSATQPAPTAAPTAAGADSTIVTLPADGKPAPAPKLGEAPAAVDGQPAAVVPALLQLKAKQLGAGDLDLATLAGKPTAFWFWAPT
jgi:hypothetical protein